MGKRVRDFHQQLGVRRVQGTGVLKTRRVERGERDEQVSLQDHAASSPTPLSPRVNPRAPTGRRPCHHPSINSY